MDDQLTRQTDDIRTHFQAQGFLLNATSTDGALIEATIPSARNHWTAKVAADATAKPERLEATLWKDGSKVYGVPLNPAAPGDGIASALRHVFTFSITFDPNSTNEEIDRAVTLIKDTTPHNTHGFMHDKSSIAVLAQAVLRLTARIEQLEKRSHED